MATSMDTAEDVMLFDPLIQDSEEAVDYSSKDRSIVQEGKQLYLYQPHTIKLHVIIILMCYLLI